MKLTREESQALSFIAAMLLISAGAKILSRPGPVEIHGQEVSLAELQSESFALMTPAQARSTADELGWLNVNAATEAELARVPDVGPALAAAIVALRSTHGRFSGIHELKAVPGMKKKALESLADVASFGTWDDPLRVGAPVGRAALAQEANQKAGQKPGAKPRGGTSAPGTRPPPPAPPPVILKRDSGAVPVNSATAVELEALPGIGPALAVRIVAWRTENGPFRDLAALDSVPGIGPALLQRLRPLLRF
jgi:competence ComEA-like helix-hairpin-helix protein